jgi:hypothetical protein
LLETEKEANVCSAAIEVVSEIGDAAALPHLARLCTRFPNDPFLTFAVQAVAERIASSGDS